MINKKNNDMIACPICNELKSKYGIKNHVRVTHLGDKSSITHYGGRSVPWNYGLRKDTDDRVLKISNKVSRALRGKPGKPHTEESKLKLRQAAMKNNLGGHTSKLRLSYKGVILQSSYEIEVAKSLDENSIKWNRPSPINWIDKNDIIHRYYPDFYLEDYDVYLDPKNDYLIKKDLDKIKRVCEQNNVRVIVLNKDLLSWNLILKKINNL
jgi:hypothetical protein